MVEWKSSAAEKLQAFMRAESGVCSGEAAATESSVHVPVPGEEVVEDAQRRLQVTVHDVCRNTSIHLKKAS